MYQSNSSGLKLEKSTVDHILDHRIKISQPEKGYRFSMDPVILADHINTTGVKKVIDAGCGCGIISLLLAAKNPKLKITGIEIQEELFLFARRNILTNKLTNNIHILHNDIKNITIADIDGRADIVVSNPPYKKQNSGRLNPDSQKAIARHEIFLNIDMLFNCSKRLLTDKGKVYIIFPAERISDLILTMTKYKFTLETIKFVHTKKDTPAKLVIICAGKNSKRPCTIPSPLYINDAEKILPRKFFYPT